VSNKKNYIKGVYKVKTKIVMLFLLLVTLLSLGLAEAQNIYTFSGTGTAGFSGDGGNSNLAQHNLPWSVVLDTAGNAYIADTANNRIRKVDSLGVITTYAGTGTAGFSGDGGFATGAQLNGPTGIRLDASGNLFVADTGNDRIRKITPGGVVITTVAGNGVSGYSGDGGPATAAALKKPSALALDGVGNLFIADSGNNRIRRVSTTGTIITVAGNGASGYTGEGAALTVPFKDPQGLAFDGATFTLYIADTGNNRIRKLVAGTTSLVGGNGVAGFSGDGGSALTASLNIPRGIALDNFGNILIADSFNNRVRTIKISTGIISTFAGTGVGGYSGDGGPPTAAQIKDPRGVFMTGSGNVFIADFGNNVIRKIANAPSANVTVNTLGPYSRFPTFVVSGTATTASTALSSGSCNGYPMLLVGPFSPSYTFTSTVTSPDGPYSITCQVTNTIGEVAFSAPVVTTVDTVAPSITLDPFSPTTTSITVTLTGTFTDLTSGAASITATGPGGSDTFIGGGAYSLTVPLVAGSNLIDIIGTDNAGNINEDFSIEVIRVVDTDGDGIPDGNDACPTVFGTVAQGCPYAVQSVVTMHIIDQAKSGACPNLQGLQGSCKVSAQDADVRVYRTTDPAFQAAYGTANTNTILNDIFASNIGFVSACKTDSIGKCTAGVPATGDYLVTVKYVDPQTSIAVYTAKKIAPADFSGTLASTKQQIIKTIKKDGTFDYKGGNKVVIPGSMLEIVYPDAAVWDSDREVYPYIFTSDSDWSVDICAQVPRGYDIFGVEDVDGNLVSTTDCAQTFVNGETKVVLFDVAATGSPKEFKVKVKLKVKDPNGKQTELDLDVPSEKKDNPGNPGRTMHLTSENIQEGMNGFFVSIWQFFFSV